MEEVVIERHADLLRSRCDKWLTSPLCYTVVERISNNLRVFVRALEVNK